MSRRRRWFLVAVASLAIVAAPVTTPGAGAQTAIERPLDVLPSSMHGAVDTQAMTLKAGGVSLLLDPGPAYAYGTFDYDRFGDTEPEVKMVARGAVVNPGVIAGAVLWAPLVAQPPECGGSLETQTPPDGLCLVSLTGVTEAGGFPGYAEAFYPPFPGSPDRQHVHKCLLNKDAAGGAPTGGDLQSTCDVQTFQASPAAASADTTIEDLSTSSFTRLFGLTFPNVLVGASEGRQVIQPNADGQLVTSGSSTARNVNLFNGAITISSVTNEASIVAAAGEPEPRQAGASCRLEGLRIMGNDVALDPSSGMPLTDGLKPLLDGLRASGLDVEFVYPPAPQVATRFGVRHSAECEGMKIMVTDTRAGSQLSGRFGIDLGYIKVSNSVTDADAGGGFDTSGGDAFGSGAGDYGTTSGDAVGSGDSEFGNGAAVLSDTTTGDLSALSGADTVAAPPAGTDLGGGASGSSGGGRTVPTRLVNAGPDKTAVAGWTLASAVMLGLGVWLLIGVVGALAAGGPIRLPGTRFGR